jgi:acetyl esterase
MYRALINRLTRTGRAVLAAVAVSLAMPLTAIGQPADPMGMLSPTDIELTAAERAELEVGLNPEAWFAERLRAPRIVVDGERLNAKLQFLFEQAPASAPDTRETALAAFATPEQRAAVRAAADRRWRLRTAITAEMAEVTDRRIAGREGEIALRIYRPVVGDDRPLPVLVYFHGGGFVFSSVEAVDRMARLMANEGQVIVVSVDYRLAPEHPYPAAHNDAEDAYLWVRAHAASLGGDPELVGIGGDSAGGHLAVVTSLRQVGQIPPTYQLLYYPAVSMGQDERSYELFDEGFGLDRGFMEAVTALTFPDAASFGSVEASPVTAPSLAGMPATIVVTAGYDPLRDQARRFAGRLEAEGSSVIYLNYGSLTHSFLNWSGVIEEAEAAARETAALFGRAIRSRAGVVALAEPARP